jgi:hypothetical protein
MTMEKALATFHNGHIELDQPVTWPEGTRLVVAPTTQQLGLPESEWPTTQQEKDEWLEWLKNLEPFDMTPDEHAAFEADLKASKELQKELLRQSWRKEEQA